MADLSDGDRSALRLKEFGFVFQFGHLVPELTCLENVALPLRLAGRSRRESERAAAQWLSGSASPTWRRSARARPPAARASAGDRRALIHEPRVVFADEPTGALDSLNGERVMELLTASARETGAAVVLVTHEPRVAAYADRSVTVRDGRASDLQAASA